MLKDLKVGNNKMLNNLIGIALIIVIIIVVMKVYKGFKNTSNVVGQSLGNEVISTTLDIPVPRVVYIRSEATRLWDKGVNRHGWPSVFRNYDEEMFISTINEMVTAKEVGLLDQLYQEASGERLKDAIEASFDAGDKSKVNGRWLAILNS